jgi:hypothetical protein
MKISEFLYELRNRNALLYYFGWTNVLLLAGCVMGYSVDDTQVMGINAWIKPMKFAISVAVYSWTFGWLLHYIKSERSKSFITWAVVVTMFVENFIITLQAARGETSHYNITSVLNASLFSTMGTFIAINTLVNFYTVIIFFIKGKTTLTGHHLAAWRGGLVLFFLGSISGGLMISNMAHTFGSTDGGVGLPFTNWSTQAGDMRAAHFFTLHGLQAIPLLGSWLATKFTKPVLTVVVFIFLYSAVCLFMHFLALSGRPLISF